MGSRPPRQQPIPKPLRQPRLMTDTSATEPAGLSMSTLGPFIGFAAFPVALGAAFIGFAVTSDTSTIGAALVVTAIVAVGLWALARFQTGWRRTARMSNELLLALLVAVIGFMLLNGGLAAVSLPWIVAGAVVLAVAWLIGRRAPVHR